MGTVTLLSWVLVVLVVIALYIALVTYMAANEASETSRSAVAAAVAGIVVSVLTVLAAVVMVHPSIGQIALVGGFLIWTGRALGLTYVNPCPETVGPAVGACVLGLVVLDAAFAAIADIGWALAALAFLVLALSCARLFDVS